MKPPKKTWLLIADGGRAKIMEHTGPGRAFRDVEGLEYSADHRPNRELFADRPSRVFESHGATRHSIEPKVDPHRELKRSFAAVLSDLLTDHLTRKEFDRLIVAAPPAMLGDLRNCLSATVKAVVIAELDKDLTKTPKDELGRHLQDVVLI